MSTPDVTVEARGVLCPVPIIRLARTAGALPEASLVELLTDDPAAAYDVPAWCRLRGHQLLRTEPLGGDAPAATVSGSAAGTGSTGPEPHAPNGNPAQALRHLIRLGGTPGMPGPPAPA